MVYEPRIVVVETPVSPTKTVAVVGAWAAILLASFSALLMAAAGIGAPAKN